MKSKENFKIRSTVLILLESTYISLGTFYVGYSLGVLNQSQTCIEIVNGWSEKNKKIYNGLLTSLLPLGALIGSILTGIISEKFGKRRGLILTDFVGILGCVLMMFIGAPLFLGRFITGLVAGANTVTVSSYINEISPISMISKTGTIISIMINFGIFFSFIMGLNLPDESYMIAHKDELNWWRLMVAFPIITCVMRIFVLVFLVKTDTPEYYISLNREEDAKMVLRKYYEEEDVDPAFNELKNKLSNVSNLRMMDLFNYKYKKRLMIGTFLSVIQQFSGINAVIFYSNEIFMKEDNGSDSQAKIFTTIVGVVLIITAYLSGKFIEKFGRKTILITGELVCSIMLFFLMLSGYLNYDEPTKYLILIFIFSFGASLGPVVWVYIPEILPEKGMGIATMANWLSCFLIGLFFPILLDVINIEGGFLIFFITSVSGLIFIEMFVLETHHKTKEEIEEMFMKHVKSDESDKLNL